MTKSKQYSKGMGLIGLLIFLGLGMPLRAQVYYTDQPTFVAACPGLPTEDFEEANIGAGNVVGIPNPLDEFTSNAVFSPLDILSGLSLSSNGPNVAALYALAVLGAGFAGNPSKNVFANVFTDTLDLNFSIPTTCVGADLFSIFSASTLDINIYGAGDVLLYTTSAPGTNAGSFWGVSSIQAITRINFSSQAGWAEGVDNVSFGGEEPGISKEITSGPIGDDDEIDLAIQIGQPGTTLYDFTITYNNPDGPDVVILDTVPAEWQVLSVSPPAPFQGANKKNDGKSATIITWTPDPDGGAITVLATTRQKNKNGKYAPTSCGPLYLNNGAQVFELVGGVPLPEPLFTSNNLCLVAVEDVLSPFDGIVPDGSGDEDGDGLEDRAEACTIGTNPCLNDTDGDGLDDGAEIGAGTDPLNPDTDGDGESDGTDPAPLDPCNPDPLDPVCNGV